MNSIKLNNTTENNHSGLGVTNRTISVHYLENITHIDCDIVLINKRFETLQSDILASGLYHMAIQTGTLSYLVAVGSGVVRFSFKPVQSQTN